MMAKLRDKYFLYIDILGFASLVTRAGRVEDIYARIDNLNAHQHVSFKTLGFSDTILVYNVDDLDWDDHDKTALVTRLCEFAEDLFYRLVSEDVHFRAYICRGDFRHTRIENIDAFYGSALIRAHQREGEIQCTGLFIENELVPYLGWYKSDSYDDRCQFVHLMQTLNNISYEEGSYPLDWNLIVPTGNEVYASYDITYLANIHRHMNDVRFPPRIRMKYLATWQMLQKKHRALLDVLERSIFDPRAVCDIDWKPILEKIGTAEGCFG